MTEEYDYRMNGVNQPSHKAHFRKHRPQKEIIHSDEVLGVFLRALNGSSGRH